jgi:hypothetical protein
MTSSGVDTDGPRAPPSPARPPHRLSLMPVGVIDISLHYDAAGRLGRADAAL